jgi:hypothetical protein
MTSSSQVLQTSLAAFIQPDAAGRSISYSTANAFCSAFLGRCDPLGYPNPDREGKLTNFRKLAKCILTFNIHPEQSDPLGPGDMEYICRALESRNNRWAAAAFALQWVMTARIGVIGALEPEVFDIEGGFLRIGIFKHKMAQGAVMMSITLWTGGRDGLVVLRAEPGGLGASRCANSVNANQPSKPESKVIR